MADQDFRIIDTRHEQAAVHMADAWSRLTEQPGVCMYTTPGFANAIPGLTNALHTEAPVISIAGSADMHDLGRGAQQEIDQVHMAAPVTKGSFMVDNVRRIPEFIARAMRLAFSGRRGPVHLTIPIDIQEQSVEEDDVGFIEPDGYRPKAPQLTDPELVRKAIALLHHAQKPLLVAGIAAGYTLSGESMQRFIETTRLPLLTEEQSRGLVGDDHPYVFGYFERGLNRAAAKVREADRGRVAWPQARFHHRLLPAAPCRGECENHPDRSIAIRDWPQSRRCRRHGRRCRQRPGTDDERSGKLSVARSTVVGRTARRARRAIRVGGKFDSPHGADARAVRAQDA